MYAPYNYIYPNVHVHTVSSFMVLNYCEQLENPSDRSITWIYMYLVDQN